MKDWAAAQCGPAGDDGNFSVVRSNEVPEVVTTSRNEAKNDAGLYSTTKSRLRSSQQSTRPMRTPPGNRCSIATTAPDDPVEPIKSSCSVERTPENEVPHRDEAMWASNTKSKLRNAQALRHEAESQLRRTFMEHNHGHVKREQVGTRQQSQLRQKIDTTENWTRTLLERKECSLYAIRSLGASVFQLSKAHAGTWGPLDIVERRLELREKRSPQERIQDHFQKALENERLKLHSAQQQLVERLNTSRNCLAELENLNTMIDNDIKRKRHASRLDRALFRQDPDNVRVDDSILPPMPCASPGGDEEAARPQSARAKASNSGPGNPNSQTGKWHLGAQQLYDKAQKQEAMAAQLCQENEMFLHGIKQNLDAVRKATANHMKMRIAETLELRRALEQEIIESDLAIINMEDCVAKTRKECDKHQLTLLALQKSVAVRNSRIHGERIRDTVQIATEDARDVIDNTMLTLQEQLQRKQEILEQMKAARQSLQEDLRHKVDTFTIDVNCSRVCQRPHSSRDGKQGITKPHFLRKGTTVTQKAPTGNNSRMRTPEVCSHQEEELGDLGVADEFLEALKDRGSPSQAK